MRIGLISTYSFDTPGGVQFHIKDLAEELQKRGHYVNVLAPASKKTELPEYVTSGGKAVPIKYNGSIARLSFGPKAAAKTKQWLDQHQFDLIHPHEPINPSLAMLAVWQTTTPVVATFHSNLNQSRTLKLAKNMGWLNPTLNKINARIAVSEQARLSLFKHLGIDSSVIPNGVSENKYAQAITNPKWLGELPQSPVIAFLGRLDEPRKGLPVLVEAIPNIVAKYPGARFLVAGPGKKGKAAAIANLGSYANSVTFLGTLTETEKAQLLKSADIYIAPQTGGESFGIVLIEAMSAGTAVIASDIPAFSAVLADGKAGELFPVGDASALAATVIRALADQASTQRRADFASEWVRQFDWEPVTTRILNVYHSVL